MVICKNLEQIYHLEESVLTIGSFDGMHQGHLEIISHLVDISKLKNIPSVVITFDPHPRSVIKTSRHSIEHILSIKDKIDILENHAVDYVWVIPFDKEFSKLTAGEFLEKYISSYFNPIDMIVGYDHHFGFNREGSLDFLQKNKKQYGYNLHIKEPILYHNTPISSSRIRSYLRSGSIVKANECLGWDYKLSGEIVRGQGRGSELNFPTANIQPYISNQLIPRHGVYCVDAVIENSYYSGMCNIGKRPTFHNNGEEIIEVHLFLNNTMNLYGKDIILTFKKYIREEKKYKSSTELIKQLELDRQACFST